MHNKYYKIQRVETLYELNNKSFIYGFSMGLHVSDMQ